MARTMPAPRLGWSPRALAAAWTGGLGLCVAASGLSASAGRPPEIFLPIGLSSAIFVTSGYLMARRRPANPVGYALGAVGLLSAGLVTLRYVVVWAEVFNIALSSAGSILLAWVLLAYPAGTLPGRTERLFVAGVTVAFALLALATILTVEPAVHGTSRCPPCEPNPFRIADLGAFAVVNSLSFLVIVVSGAAVAYLSVRRWWRARGTGRRVLAPVLLGGILTAVGFVFIGLVYISGGAFPLGGQVALLLRILIPIGLSVTFVLVYATRGAVAGAIVQLGASPNLEALESALRRTLGDPELTVARWSAAAGAHLDREGRRVDLERLPVDRAALRLERDGQPLAVVVHDATLQVDADLVATVADAVRFAVDTAEMRDQLRARGGDAATLPRGEVAFLFGDLEGSTELLAQLGDRYVDVLAELRRIVREVTDRYGGRVVDARADECFLVFADPERALATALELQRRLREATWPAEAHPLMRIGVHFGSPELTPDGYVGIDVHRAARVMAAAHGGQVLASSPVVMAIRDHAPEGVALVPLGYYSLKGIAEPEFLYRVTAAGQMVGAAETEMPPRAQPAG